MLEKLQKIFEDITGRDDVIFTYDTVIDEKLGLSSFGIVQLVCAIEDEFDIEIPNSEIIKFTTIKYIVEYLEKNV